MADYGLIGSGPANCLASALCSALTPRSRRLRHVTGKPRQGKALMFATAVISAISMTQPSLAQSNPAMAKADIAKAISDRTYIFPSSIKTIIVYFGPNGRGVTVLANGDTLSFKPMPWGVRGVSGGGYGPCWRGHGTGSICASYDYLRKLKSFPGDKYELMARKTSDALRAALR